MGFQIDCHGGYEVIHFAIYEASGKILRTGKAPNENIANMQCNSNELIVVGVESETHPNTHYFNIETNTVVLKRPIQYQIDKPSIKADGLDTLTVSGLPVGTSVSCEGVTYQVDGDILFSTDLGKTYAFILMHPLHSDTLLEINAV